MSEYTVQRANDLKFDPQRKTTGPKDSSSEIHFKWDLDILRIEHEK